MSHSKDTPASSDSLSSDPEDGTAWELCPHCGRAILERPLTKRQLADFFTNSTKWVEKLCAEGMPFIQVEGQKRFVLSRCLKWLWMRAELRRRQH